MIGSRKLSRIVLAVLVASPISQAVAQETTTYTYDAKGRVIGVTRSGGPSNGVSTSYSYDAADNRTNVTVSGSGNNGSDSNAGATAPGVRYAVVPLGGYKLIIIK